jgi:hypothetical protein
MMFDRTFGADDLARRWGVDKGKILDWMLSGKFPAPQAATGVPRWSLDEVLKFERKHKRQ